MRAAVASTDASNSADVSMKAAIRSNDCKMQDGLSWFSTLSTSSPEGDRKPNLPKSVAGFFVCSPDGDLQR